MSTQNVVVIGGGPVGLTAALLLARNGVGVQVFERRAGTSIHPRARGLNVRTMEVLRVLGLEQAVRDAGAALKQSRYMLFVETLAGREIRRVADDDLVATGDALDQWTPCNYCQCAQNELESILLQAARSYGADIHFNSEVTGIAQDGAGVDVRVRHNGEQQMVRARYVVAADGAKSPVRGTLGIGQRDGGMFGSYVNIYFRADLREVVRDRWFGICFVENPESPGLFLAVNNSDRWLFNAEYDPATDASPADFTPERCLELVRAAVGMPDLDVELLSVLPWEAAARIAETFQSGRVFLVGDAAHVMPPAGAFGMNTGIQDAHNIAWKLAAVLRGEATPQLLETYATEREAAAMLVVGEAIREVEAPTPDTPATHRGPPDGENDGPPYGPPDGKADPTAMLVPVLAYRYETGAFLPEERPEQVEGLELLGMPGTRAPHVWLEYKGRRISTIDLFDRQFVLLIGSEGEAWSEAARHVPFVLPYRIAATSELADPSGMWHEAYGITPSGAVLVRPDGVVAWRSRSAVANPQQELARVLGTVLY